MLILCCTSSLSEKDSCSKRCQISKCSLCYYERVRVKQPQRPRCEPCQSYSDRHCWYKYYQCRRSNYGTYNYGYYVSILSITASILSRVDTYHLLLIICYHPLLLKSNNFCFFYFSRSTTSNNTLTRKCLSAQHDQDVTRTGTK